MGNVLAEVTENVIAGRRAIVEAKVREALELELEPERILNQALIPAMAKVGDLYEGGDFYVPEMLIAARAMQSGLAIVRPLLAQEGVPMRGKAVIGTVKGDLHDIGKNLVAMMWEGAGFEVIDLGTDVPPHKFATAARQHGALIVGMSALLTTTMRSMKSAIQALEDLGVRDQVKVLIGGAPVTESYAGEIGADGFAPDASRAVALAESVIR